MKQPAPVRRLVAVPAKPQTAIAAELADEIRAVIDKRAGIVSLALVLGVLQIVGKECLDDATE